MLRLRNCGIEIINCADTKPGAVLYFFCAEKVDITPAADMAVAMIYPCEWNSMMTPWKSAGNNSTGDGDVFAEEMVKNIIPVIEEQLGFEQGIRGVGGYSLGGLEALYMSTQYRIFDFAGSVSGSMWYENALEYFENNRMNVKHAFISLGKREAKTNNPMRKSVLENTVKIVEKTKEYAETVFLMENGGHFTDISGRIERCKMDFNSFCK